MFKKAILLTLSLALSFSLVACGGDEKNDLNDVVASTMRPRIFDSANNAETFVNAEPNHAFVTGDVDDSVNEEYSDEDTFIVIDVKDNSVNSVIVYLDRLEGSLTAQDVVDAGMGYLPTDDILEKYFKKPVYKKYKVKNDSSEEIHYLIGYKLNPSSVRGMEKIYDHDLSLEVVEVDGVFTRMFINPYFEDIFKTSEGVTEEQWDLNK